MRAQPDVVLTIVVLSARLQALANVRAAHTQRFASTLVRSSEFACCHRSLVRPDASRRTRRLLRIMTTLSSATQRSTS